MMQHVLFCFKINTVIHKTYNTQRYHHHLSELCPSKQALQGMALPSTSKLMHFLSHVLSKMLKDKDHLGLSRTLNGRTEGQSTKVVSPYSGSFWSQK